MRRAGGILRAVSAPEPPVPLPPGFVVHVAGRGEFFVRDTGGPGRPVLLDAPTFEVAADHMACSSHPRRFNAALLRALQATAPACATSAWPGAELAAAG